jgi:hypothetical protein
MYVVNLFHSRVRVCDHFVSLFPTRHTPDVNQRITQPRIQLDPPSDEDALQNEGIEMKRIVTSIALVVGLGAGAAFAQGSALTSLDLNTLTADQLKSLGTILSGLPRQ